MLQIPTFQRVVILSVLLLGVLLAMPNAFYSRVELHNDAAQMVENGFAPAEEVADELALGRTLCPLVS